MRRTLGITATAAAISMAAILPAGAQDGPGIDTYHAGAAARALDLTVFGETMTLSSTAAGITHKPEAAADGQAVFTPLFQSEGAKVATGATKQDCAKLPVPLPAEVLTDLVCVTTSAKLIDGKPIGTSAADEIVIEIQAPPVLEEVPDEVPLNTIVNGVKDGLVELFGSVKGVTEPLEEQTKIDLQGILEGLLQEIEEGDVLVRITVAPVSSVSELTDTGVSAQAASNGAILELLPNLEGGALVVATVGTSSSGVVRDVKTGAPKLTGGAALIDIAYPNELLSDPLSTLSLQIKETLGVDAGLDVTSVLGTILSTLPCDATNPLSGVVCFSVGKSTDLDAAAAKAMGFDFGPTTVGRTSSVLDLRVLTGSLPAEVPSQVQAAAPTGGVVLKIGETVAAAAATTPLPLTTPESPQPLPRTGGDATLPLTLALLALGMGGAALVRRSRTI